MTSDATGQTGTNSAKLKAGLVETNQKVEASLLTSIEEHLQNHSSKAGLDFLHVKNSLLLSYLIDLTLYLKQKLSGKKPDSENLKRLNEMKVVLDKMRGLDKKLRYQIDKLLQAENAASYASSGVEIEENGNNDPLQYRPDPKALRVNGEDSSTSSSGEGDESENENLSDSEQEADMNDNDDDDLAAARMTVAMSREKQRSNKGKKSQDEDDDNEPGIYRAPRHTAVPYTHDKEDKEEKRQKREIRRARASELAQSLRHQYGEAPEQEDYHGGSDYGKQLQAARRFAEREAEKTKYEESAMIRLTTTRKEKKERKRIMRAEVSNLNGIADLSNLTRDANRVIDTQGAGDDNVDESGRGGGSSFHTERHINGKRKKEMIDADGRQIKPKARKGGKSKNSFQAALFGEGGSKKKKKSKRS